MAHARPDAGAREAMDKEGNVINPTTPEGAAQYMRSEQNRYAVLIKKADVKVD